MTKGMMKSQLSTVHVEEPKKNKVGLWSENERHKPSWMAD